MNEQNLNPDVPSVFVNLVPIYHTVTGVYDLGSSESVSLLFIIVIFFVQLTESIITDLEVLSIGLLGSPHPPTGEF